MPGPDDRRAACPACGGKFDQSMAYPGAANAAARSLGLSGIEVCGACGFGRALPCPDQAQLDHFYASGAYWHASGNLYQIAHERVQAGVRVRRCVPLLPDSGALCVLDVGAGHGFIAQSLEALGCVAAYDFIEPDESAARYISSAPTRFPRRRLRSLSGEPPGTYDVLFLNHVLEHVADPEAFLRGLMPHLKAAALAYVETPLADQRFKADVFPHVLFFTPPSLAALGKRLGVQTLAVEAFGRFPGQPLAQKAADLAFRFAVRARSRLLQRAVDHAIWDYSAQPDGVWLRWIFRKGSPAG